MNEVTISKSKEPKPAVLVIFLLSIYAFFGYLFPHNIPYYILVTSLSVIIFSFMMKKNILVSHEQICIILLIVAFVLIQVLPAKYSLFPSSSMKTAINRSAILAIGALIYIQGNWYKNGIKFLFYFSCIHALSTGLSYFAPTLFCNIVLPILPSNTSSEFLWFMSRGLYSGITDQIGKNAFYISVGISVLFTELVTYNLKVPRSKYIILGFFLLTLLLTGKRGSLVANLISMVFVSGIIAKFKNQSFFLKTFKVVIILSFVSVILVYVFPESAAPFMRFIARQGGDQTSGRLQLYLNAIDLFKQRPILGWGTGVFSNLYGLGNHNLYLQLLSENGLVGFLTFSSILVMNFINTLKAIKKNIFSGQSGYNRYICFSLYIQIFFVIYGMTGNPLNDGFILVIYLIASSIPYTLKVQVKHQRVGDSV